jgi:hypothetical protein
LLLDPACVFISFSQAAKDGFLAKKEFLERCDLRAFEKEKDQRATKRDK